MQLFKLTIILMATLILTSCMTTKYHVEVAPRYPQYTYKDSFRPPPLFETIDVKEYSAGKGIGISLIETTKITFARLSYFYSEYSKSTRSITGFADQDVTIDVTRSGFEGAVGFSIGFFKPYISYHLIETDDPLEEDDFQYGYGARIEIPAWGKSKISLDYNRHEDRDEVFEGRSATTIVSLGIMFGGWELWGNKKKRGRRY